MHGWGTAFFSLGDLCRTFVVADGSPSTAPCLPCSRLFSLLPWIVLQLVWAATGPREPVVGTGTLHIPFHQTSHAPKFPASLASWLPRVS